MQRKGYVAKAEIPIENHVDHPSHYNHDGIETIDKMIRIWGKQRVIEWCEITAFKYRDRAGYKNDITEDINKALWYETKAKALAASEPCKLK